MSFLGLVLMLATSAFGQSSWTKHGVVMTPGAPGEWDDQLVAPGTVIHQGSVYKMWYSGYDGANLRVGYATSPDGINWTKHVGPVLELGSSWSWEDNWVGFPMVYFDGALYRMWYLGDDGTNERTGYATSADGISWTKYSGNPVITLGASGTWDDICAGPGPVVFDTAFHMIYSGFENSNVCRGGYVTSPDGIQWTKSPNPVLDLGTWDTPRVQVNSILYDSSNSRYVAYYGGGDIFTWRIGYATAASLSGPWTKLGSRILDVTAGAWDNRSVAFPCVLYDSTNKQYNMWYMGGSSAWTGSVGYATAPLTGVNEGGGDFPKAFKLAQNYPNPFNPATTISYELSANGFVSLKVYDVLGREVKTLVNEVKRIGRYEVRFDASCLASGVYLYRIKAGTYTAVRKMLVL